MNHISYKLRELVERARRRPDRTFRSCAATDRGHRALINALDRRGLIEWWQPKPGAMPVPRLKRGYSKLG